MKPSFVFSFLRVATGILFYSLIVITLTVIVSSVLKFSGNTIVMGKPVFDYEVMAFGTKNGTPEVHYSVDKLVQYTSIPNRYHLEVEPKSVLGYYSFFSTVANLLFGIVILWLFKRIFSEANLAEPFKPSIFKRLQILALLFAVSDVVKFANYLIFNRLLHRSISVPEFQYITEIGNGIITGLVIYAIAIIYQRGLSIQEENALTV
jgi:Protein of unknown function (DUF2975)